MDALTSNDLEAFLDSRVNLRREDVIGFRDQVAFLRDRLELYVGEHPNFALHKMLLFGSLAEGTATSTCREMDVAVYLRPESMSSNDVGSLLPAIRELLLKVYPQMESTQFTIDPPAVRITFRTSGLTVDVVPVIPNGKPDDRGLLAIRGSAGWIETSIPLHLEFIRSRGTHHSHFRRLVRLTKWWRDQKAVPLTSFVIELIWAHLIDHDLVIGDLQEGLLAFFAYLERSRLGDRIVFDDYYQSATSVTTGGTVEVIDPVNPGNNAAASMSAEDRDSTIRAAEDAVDLVAAGSTAHSRGRGVAAYAAVFGEGFGT